MTKTNDGDKDNDTGLESRMRGYELKHKLPEHMPIILRLDGRAFHTFTRGMKKPFDLKFIAMLDTVGKLLCEDIQNCKFAYLQSDEISFLLYQASPDSGAWFDNRVDKICSVVASRAASVATQYVLDNFEERYTNKLPISFDARANVYPANEVTNYFIWRQQDWSRNSLQMLARAHYSHKQLNNRSQADMHELIHQAGDNWNSLPVFLRRGRCLVKKTTEEEIERNGVTFTNVIRSKWVVDINIPIFTKDRGYIEKFLEDDP